jgi:hypothetical protein
MYKRLIWAVDHSDIRWVLGNLQEASQERHIPAFQRCVVKGSVENGCGGDERGGHHHMHRRVQ